MDVLGRVWSTLKKVEDLLALQGKTRESLERFDDRLRVIEDRLLSIESGKAEVITEARAAAGIAATGLSPAMLADVVTRPTRVEMKFEEAQRRLIPQPRTIGAAQAPNPVRPLNRPAPEICPC